MQTGHVVAVAWLPLSLYDSIRSWSKPFIRSRTFMVGPDILIYLILLFICLFCSF